MKNKSFILDDSSKCISCRLTKRMSNPDVFEYRFFNPDKEFLFDIHCEKELNPRFIKLILSLINYGN